MVFRTYRKRRTRRSRFTKHGGKRRSNRKKSSRKRRRRSRKRRRGGKSAPASAPLQVIPYWDDKDQQPTWYYDDKSYNRHPYNPWQWSPKKAKMFGRKKCKAFKYSPQTLQNLIKLRARNNVWIPADNEPQRIKRESQSCGKLQKGLGKVTIPQMIEAENNMMNANPNLMRDEARKAVLKGLGFKNEKDLWAKSDKENPDGSPNRDRWGKQDVEAAIKSADKKHRNASDWARRIHSVVGSGHVGVFDSHKRQ